MNATIPTETLHGAAQGSEAISISRDRAFSVLSLWWRRATTRRQLAELDDRMLADVGIDWVEARREATKSFWQT